jgi:hypothetical protein
MRWTKRRNKKNKGKKISMRKVKQPCHGTPLMMQIHRRKGMFPP